MYIDPDECISCQECIPYCPMSCIVEGINSIEIIEDECVECGICLRNANCPTGAIKESVLTMPRVVRKAFSDPFGKHENIPTKYGGRGTAEIKTNDVTGLVNSPDRVAFAIEMGRPGIGARFSDVQTITRKMSAFDIVYEKLNPVTPNIIDQKTGEIDPEILNEKVLSCIIEFTAAKEDIPNILAALQEVSADLDTVFSLSIICKVDENNRTVVEDIIAGYGYALTSSKTNLGLGRPRYEDRVKGGMLK